MINGIFKRKIDEAFILQFIVLLEIKLAEQNNIFKPMDFYYIIDPESR